MVHQKKNSIKAKQQTPNKQKNKKDEMVDYEMDSDESGSDEQVLKKTPTGKTPKGKQNDKRVSFQIPGKNTPATKTPKGENALAKKQLTPGKKTNLKEFPGMGKNSAKKNGTPKKPAADDDDDEDDDDDDDDDEDDDDEGADLDMLLGGDDDDDDDDDDDEEDEDDDDDDDDEDDDDEDEEAEVPQTQQKKKQDEKKKQNETQNAAAVQKQTPAKSNKDAKNVEKQTPKQQVKNQSPSKAETATPVVKKALQIEADRRRARDVRTLFVGNLPADVTAQELKALSTDILSVNIPKISTKNKRKSVFAFLEFVDENKAEDNYKSLQSKKLRNQPIKIDFTGVKRQSFAKDANESLDDNKPINLKKLHVSSLPDDVTMDKLAPFFPKSYQVTINTTYGGQKTGAVFYNEEKDAAADLEASKNAILKGKPITVLYSVSKDRSKKRKKSKAKHPASKKMKVELKQESDDDDDDDDDDEDDE